MCIRDRTWITCVDNCRNLTEGGYNDWRMPTFEEAIMYRTNRAIPTPSGGFNLSVVWTSTPAYYNLTGNTSTNERWLGGILLMLFHCRVELLVATYGQLQSHPPSTPGLCSTRSMAVGIGTITPPTAAACVSCLSQSLRYEI
ncbi:MAG: DUF1566 domain-containing protein, partial [Bacteroidales bacterium]|nr:DUF1566 domain-containing protein [Bacteroidales bacterium]